MILCCDVINLVRRASKDLKLAKDLKRKRSEAVRSPEGGRFTVVQHSIREGEQEHRKDYAYSRDTVNKVVKVHELDSQFQYEDERTRQAKFTRTIGSPDRDPGMMAGTMRSTQSLKSTASRPKRLSSTQSRYKDLKRSSHSNCHRHAHGDENQEDSINANMASFAPLRSNGGSIVQKIVQGPNKRPDFDEIERIPGGENELSPIRSSAHSSPSRPVPEQHVYDFHLAQNEAG